MSKKVRKAALLALAMWGTALAGGSKSPDTLTSEGLNTSSVSAGRDSNSNGESSTTGESASNQGSDKNIKILQRKRARASRHADIDKARQQELDSVRAAFARRQAAEMSGSSEIVNERLKQAKATDAKKGK